MNRLALGIALVALLNGCASSPEMLWHHPTKTLQEFYADLSECQAQGAQAASTWQPGSIYALSAQKQARDQCMMGRGWYLAPAQER